MSLTLELHALEQAANDLQRQAANVIALLRKHNLPTTTRALVNLRERLNEGIDEMDMALLLENDPIGQAD